MENKDNVNMPTYSIEHPNWAGCVCVAEYELPWVDGEGRRVAQLRRVTFNERSAYHFINPVLVRLPAEIQCSGHQLPAEFQRFTAARCTVKDITVHDLSFARFWNTYGYKVGNRAAVEKKWTALKAEDRLLALQGAARQRRHSEQHRTDMPYPQTYIDQRRWEGEF